MLGTSVGVSLLSTVVARETQINWNQLGAHINPFSTHFRSWLQQQHLGMRNPKAIIELKINLLAQSNMVAFIDAYYLIAVILILFIPLVLFMRHVDLKSGVNINKNRH